MEMWVYRFAEANLEVGPLIRGTQASLSGALISPEK
jgi:hypothetical protein